MRSPALVSPSWSSVASSCNLSLFRIVLAIQLPFRNLSQSRCRLAIQSHSQSLLRDQLPSQPPSQARRRGKLASVEGSQYLLRWCSVVQDLGSTSPPGRGGVSSNGGIRVRCSRSRCQSSAHIHIMSSAGVHPSLLIHLNAVWHLQITISPANELLDRRQPDLPTPTSSTLRSTDCSDIALFSLDHAPRLI